MQGFQQSSRTLVQAIERFKSSLVVNISKAITLVLCVLVPSDAWKADESVIRGQVQGMERAEGVWVGLDTGKRILSHFQHAPFDDAFIKQERNEVEDWMFSPDGGFELRSDFEESVNLIVISKNRIPILFPITPDGNVQPLQINLSRGMELEGIVHDSSGIPISGAKVSIRPSRQDYEIPSFAIPQWVTESDGSFRVSGLKRGEFLLIVSANDYAPIVVPNFVVPDTEVHRLEVELLEGHFVTGKVINEYGTPTPAVSIGTSWTRSYAEVVESDGVMKVGGQNRFGWYFPRTQTLEDGTFRLGPFEHATNGFIRANSPDFGSARTSGVSAPSDGLHLRLQRERIQGRVFDAATEIPIEEVSVHLYNGGSGREGIQTKEGYFELPVGPVSSRETAVLIDAPGYFPWIGRLYQGSTGIYDLGNVMLERERTLKGIVRNGEVGTPLKEVHILRDSAQYVDRYIRALLSNWGQQHRAITNEKGEFLLKKLPRDADRLKLITPSKQELSIDIRADVEEFDIDLHFNGVIEGALALPDGTTVEGIAELRGSSITSRPIQTVDGVFRWEGLSPGKYWLTGETEAGLVKSRTVNLEAGERLTDIELRVTPGGSAKGTITGLKGDERVEIAVKDSEQRVLISKRFGNGSYVVHGVPNEALISARTSTGRLSIRLFDSGNEEGGPIDFRFDDESELRGLVLSGGEPVQGMSLSVVPKNVKHVAGYTTTTASGSYVIKGLSDGPHVVRTPTGYSFEIVIDGKTMSDIELPHNSVSGIVRSEQTRIPIGGGVVVVNGLDIPVSSGPSVGIKTIGSDGTFTFTGLIPGDYEIEVVHLHAEKVSIRVKVEGSETIELLVQCANTQECNYGGYGPRRTVKTR